MLKEMSSIVFFLWVWSRAKVAAKMGWVAFVAIKRSAF